MKLGETSFAYRAGMIIEYDKSISSSVAQKQILIQFFFLANLIFNYFYLISYLKNNFFYVFYVFDESLY